MNIQLRITGGFGGFPKPRTFHINSEELPETEAGELQRLLGSTDFFQRTTQVSAPRHVNDAFAYTITVEDGTRKHTVRTHDPFPDNDIASLVSFVQSHGKAQ